jgi:glutamate 5-kinase
MPPAEGLAPAAAAGSSSGRELIGVAARTVVKVGSSSLTRRGRLEPARLDTLVDALAARRRAGRQVVLVSSGAIAAGIGPLGLASRPRDLATQQAAASVGQLLLAERYAASFGRYGLTVGQVLLTADDLHRRGHYRNAVRTLERLLALGVIPIVNENDTVATQEIRFGDNDRLAALVAHLVRADALVLLSDIDGLYTADPRRRGAALVADILSEADLAPVRLAGTGSAVGTGGMATKIDAARIATGAGIPVLLAAADRIGEALAGRGGSYFAPTGKRTASRLFWLRHATTPRGRLVLDAGAVTAVLTRRVSLLTAGIVGVSGDFAAGDPVELADEAGRVLARGLVGFDSEDLPGLLGRSSHELPAELRREAVHRDDLVIL